MSDTPFEQSGIYPPYPTEALESMYPEIYYKCYPVVKSMCDRYDVPSNSGMYPSHTRVTVMQMADQIYNYVTINVGVKEDYYSYQGGLVGPGAGIGFGGGLLRPLILILLIRELLFRRGRFF